MATVRASALPGDVIAYNLKPEPLDHHFFAARAVSVFSLVARHIANITKIKPCVKRNFARGLQSFDRCRGQVFQPILGMKTRKMNRNIWTQFL